MALLLAAPSVLFLVQVVFVLPPVLLLAGAVRMVLKILGGGLGSENLTFFTLLLLGFVVFSAPYYLLAWVLGKAAAGLPRGWPRPTLLVALLAGLAWVTQQPIYGGAGHGVGEFGPLQQFLGTLDRDFGTGTSFWVYTVAIVLAVLPAVVVARRRRRRFGRPMAPPVEK